mgnify:CR=1 FL=1
MAGLYDEQTGKEYYCILTTAANNFAYFGNT